MVYLYPTNVPQPNLNMVACCQCLPLDLLLQGWQDL